MNVFIRAQLNSIFSTCVDFAVTFVLKHVMGAWYLLASVAGAVMGGVLNFLLGRYWVFQAQHHQLRGQVARYIGIWAGSLALNTAGLYLLTDLAHVHYLLAKAITVVVVAVCYNFILQKYFVFST